jgi:putative acetyltransferase
MIPVHYDPHFTFRFADNRIIPRFHLEGVEAGRRVSIFKIDPGSGERLGLLGTAAVGDGGWVDLAEPILVRAGEGFVAVPNSDPIIRPETPADLEAIFEVNHLAFGQDAEARLVDALRDGGYVRASLVAERAGRVVGHILFSDLRIITDTGTIPALALAPMAVLPEFQNQGIGSALVRTGLAHCQQQGHRIVIVLGHPNFYPRFGFSAKLAESVSSPFGSGEAWMAMEFVAGSLSGVVGRAEYPPPFSAFEK